MPADKPDKTCINCGAALLRNEGVWTCPHCNTEDLDSSRIFLETAETDEYVFIECPGATLYVGGTNEVAAGVDFIDDDDPAKGHRIVKHAVYAPTHTHRRRIRREALGRIRRCQGCQDYTIRMRRPEGADFFIPSHKHPGRKALKTVEYRTYE
ncbi:MAG: hypothetical protein KKA42_10745 [candidate division Zixibacteria bacterium]|nr:hypothetical protein [candidate division Zixibacteria bacterium]